MRWQDDAKRVAYRYKENCRELDRLMHSGKPPVPMVSARSGKISKPVEAEVMRLLANERIAHLQKATQAVEYALAVVMLKPQGETTVRLWELVYRDGTHMLYGAAMVLNISEVTAKRYNAYLLKMIAIKMGYLPTK